jgi:hypothetical protein
MAYAYVQEVDKQQSNASSIAAPTITPNAAGDQLIICVVTGLNSPVTMSDNLGTSNIYTPIGVCTFSSAGPTVFNLFFVASCQAGAQIISATGGSSNYSRILVTEYSGLAGTYSSVVFADQNGAPTGVNGINSGLAAVPQLPSMVWGLTYNFAAANVVTAGTSPLAFTNFQTIWTGGFSAFEDARVTSGASYAATFGDTDGNQYCTACIIFPESATVAWLT